jgi:hypothetical protein
LVPDDGIEKKIFETPPLEHVALSFAQRIIEIGLKIKNL